MIQLCKNTVEFPMVQHIDQIVSVAVTMRDSSPSQLCHSVRATAVSRPQEYRPESRDG